jgi:hypothetical protein
LRFAASRARPNTVRAYAHDLKTFFAVVGWSSTGMTDTYREAATRRLGRSPDAPTASCGVPSAGC